MPHILRLIIIALAALTACRGTEKAPRPAAPVAQTEKAAAKHSPQDAGSGADIHRTAAPEAAQPPDDPSQRLMMEVDQRHYDPIKQGLKELSFSLQLSIKGPGNHTETEAQGSWRGGQLELKLTAVRRQGKEIKQDTKEGGHIWGVSKELTLRLLDGLGRGYLRPRVDQFKRLKGKIRREGKVIEIDYQNPDRGITTFRLDAEHRIERLSMASSDGVNRTMSYTYQMEGKQNMIREATLSATVKKGARYPKRIKAQIRRTNGMRFGFKYVKVGRFLLPSTLHRTTPRLTKAPLPNKYGTETLLKLSYTKAL